MSATAIELSGVVFRHVDGNGDGPPFELRVPELSVGAGEAIACIGPSGSGKTTLLDLIAGIHRPAAGSLMVAGRAMHGLSAAERRRIRLAEIGLIFQTLALVRYLTAMENILLPITVEPSIAPRRGARAYAAELAERLGIEKLLRRRPRRLSQGERQRVAICRALVTRPAVLLCDEPTGNLDPARSGQTVELLIEAGRERDAAVVMATHDHTLLDRFDRVLDMAELAAGASQ